MRGVGRRIRGGDAFSFGSRFARRTVWASCLLLLGFRPHRSLGPAGRPLSRSHGACSVTTGRLGQLRLAGRRGTPGRGPPEIYAFPVVARRCPARDGAHENDGSPSHSVVQTAVERFAKFSYPGCIVRHPLLARDAISRYVEPRCSPPSYGTGGDFFVHNLWTIDTDNR